MEYPLLLLVAAAAAAAAASPPPSFSLAVLWFRECENLRSSASAAMRARRAMGRRTPFTGSTVEEEGVLALALALPLVGPEGPEVWVKLLLGKGPLEGEEAREKVEEFKEEEEEEERRVGLVDL